MIFPETRAVKFRLFNNYIRVVSHFRSDNVIIDLLWLHYQFFFGTAVSNNCFSLSRHICQTKINSVHWYLTKFLMWSRPPQEVIPESSVAAAVSSELRRWTPSLIMDSGKKQSGIYPSHWLCHFNGLQTLRRARQLWGENYEARVEWRLYEKEMKME